MIRKSPSRPAIVLGNIAKIVGAKGGEIGSKFQLRSESLTRWLELHLRHLAFAWLSLTLGQMVYKLSRTSVPVHGAFDLAQMILPYLAIAFAPIAGFLVGRGAFMRNTAQPEFRLALFGKWRALSLANARRHALYGPTGFLTSLMVGMLFAVFMRTSEFMMIQPAINAHAPAWAHTLFLAMAAELAVMNFFYMVCFVMALRSVPLFPRMLLYVWILDLGAQLAIAGVLSGTALPGNVAEPLTALLTANINTVMISVVIWLPYLMLSDRVNVTFRHRIAAAAN